MSHAKLSKRQLIGAGLAGAGALFAGIMLAHRQSSSSLKRAAKPTESLFELQLQTPVGQNYTLKALQGQPLLINFWATWCAPCIEEMPLLDLFYQEKSIKNLQFLGIACDKSEAVQGFLSRIPIRFPIALAGFDGIQLSQSLGNASGGLPFTAVLDAKADILFTKSGQLTTNDIRTITHLPNLEKH